MVTKTTKTTKTKAAPVTDSVPTAGKHWPTKLMWYDQLVTESKTDPDAPVSTEFEDWNLKTPELDLKFSNPRDAIVWLSRRPDYTNFTKDDAQALMIKLRLDEDPAVKVEAAELEQAEGYLEMIEELEDQNQTDVIETVSDSTDVIEVVSDSTDVIGVVDDDTILSLKVGLEEEEEDTKK